MCVCVCVCVCVVSLHMHLIENVYNSGCSFYLIVFHTNFYWPVIHPLCWKAFLNFPPLPFFLIYFISLHSTYDHKNKSYKLKKVLKVTISFGPQKAGENIGALPQEKQKAEQMV